MNHPISSWCAAEDGFTVNDIGDLSSYKPEKRKKSRKSKVDKYPTFCEQPRSVTAKKVKKL
jgi:hypothetical protein